LEQHRKMNLGTKYDNHFKFLNCMYENVPLNYKMLSYGKQK